MVITGMRKQALFATKGDDTMIRNITVARATLPDRHAAAAVLRDAIYYMAHSRFIDNEEAFSLPVHRRV